jgi:diguanylate cyclase (GGDEF)-like protein
MLLTALLAPASALAQEFALEGRWRPARPAEAAAGLHDADAPLQRFDPARSTRFPSPDGLAWLLLEPSGGRWPAQPWVLSVSGAGLQSVTVHLPGRGEGLRARVGRRDAGTWPGHGRLAFPVEAPLTAGAPIGVLVDARDVIASSLRFHAEPVADYLAADAWRLMLAGASLGVMLAMATMALFFAARLHDATFLFHALFLSAYAFILAFQDNYLFEPLGWTALAGAPRLWGRVAVSAGIVAAVLFLVRFADLARYAPRGRRVLLAYAGLVAATALAGVVPLLDAFGRAAINPLLVLGGVLLVGVCAQAAWRGSRYARFFLLGWTPLLAITALGSLQHYGVARAWSWPDEAGFLAGALEALIFSLGLADRTLVLRRAHEQARRQADIDPLTGLYNRRAWSERLPLLEQQARLGGAPLSLLFLDIDHFKELNDRHGHEAGDAMLRRLAEAMRAELREEDAIGRYGGEEFVVALPGMDAARAARIAERIRQRLQDQAGAGGIASTVSIGVATLAAGERMDLLLRRADRAMYEAKRSGRNRVAVAEAAL